MTSSTQTPIRIHIDPSLQHLNINLPQYLTANPQYDKLVVSAFIFDRPKEADTQTGRQLRLLIVQRASHEHSYANLWEVPGGSSDASDPTILHSLAREVFEETGLKMKNVLRQIGNVMEFTTGFGYRQKKWAKLNFEIQVMEMEDQDSTAAPASDHDISKLNSTSVDGSRAGKDGILVTIDPEEHQSFAWATLSDLETSKYTITTPEQRERMLQAFRVPGK